MQSVGWDAKGHLLTVSQVDSGTTEIFGSYVWTAQYDGMGRRIQTDYVPAGANAITIANNQIKCWFDPTSFFGMGARCYDPLSGRFLSADPLGHGAMPDLSSKKWRNERL